MYVGKIKDDQQKSNMASEKWVSAEIGCPPLTLTVGITVTVGTYKLNVFSTVKSRLFGTFEHLNAESAAKISKTNLPRKNASF
ncbi:hypothetical protein [Paenibacillus puldeungensis]